MTDGSIQALILPLGSRRELEILTIFILNSNKFPLLFTINLLDEEGSDRHFTLGVIFDAHSRVLHPPGKFYQRNALSLEYSQHCNDSTSASYSSLGFDPRSSHCYSHTCILLFLFLKTASIISYPWPLRFWEN